jgi:hypothetical protein
MQKNNSYEIHTLSGKDHRRKHLPIDIVCTIQFVLPGSTGMGDKGR